MYSRASILFGNGNVENTSVAIYRSDDDRYDVYRLCLQADGVLVLVAGNNAVPLAELIEHHDGGYSLDGAMIRQLVDAATTADNRYTPSKARREARKLDTQVMYASWQKAYRDLKKTRRNMSDVWYSQQIEKSDIAHGRDAETIRKKMKK